jgi:hypothetical protein
MRRTISDADLLVWEVFPSAARNGYADRTRLIFHCLSDRTRRSRQLELDTDVASTTRRLADAGEADLLALLEKAGELD